MMRVHLNLPQEPMMITLKNLMIMMLMDIIRLILEKSLILNMLSLRNWAGAISQLFGWPSNSVINSFMLLRYKKARRSISNQHLKKKIFYSKLHLIIKMKIGKNIWENFIKMKLLRPQETTPIICSYMINSSIMDYMVNIS